MGARVGPRHDHRVRPDARAVTTAPGTQVPGAIVFRVIGYTFGYNHGFTG